MSNGYQISLLQSIFCRVVIEKSLLNNFSRKYVCLNLK